MGSENSQGCSQKQRMTSASTFLDLDHKDSDGFLHHIIRITGDEIRVSFCEC
jgi:hypothetical protein